MAVVMVLISFVSLYPPIAPMSTYAAEPICPVASQGDSCPMGIVDYGTTRLGFRTELYNYSASEFFSRTQFTALTIGAATKRGFNDMMSLQLNVVDRDVAENNNLGTYWIQDVADIKQIDANKTFQVSFTDNIWNFTPVKYGAGIPSPINGNIFGNEVKNCTSSGISKTTQGYEFYGCVAEGKFNVTLPFTVDLVVQTGTKINPQTKRMVSYVDFNYNLLNGATAVSGLKFDRVFFDSNVPSNPRFYVYGGGALAGFRNDAENVLGGEAYGVSVAILQIKANMNMKYQPLGKETLVSIPHAWSAGSNTSETATGVMMSKAPAANTGIATSGKDNSNQLW
jgi:hypothetical protein